MSYLDEQYSAFIEGGEKTNKVHVLGRDRVMTKEGRKCMIIYKGKKMSLTDARELEKKIAKEKKKGKKSKRFSFF